MQKIYIGFILLLLLFLGIGVFYTKIPFQESIREGNILVPNTANIGGGSDLNKPSFIEKQYNEE